MQTTTPMFSWDPRARRWINEHGTSDSKRPPVAPIDDGALQTYYLDSDTGVWSATILGDRARQIATELGGAYRGAAVVGLAMETKIVSKVDLVPTPDQVRRIPKLAWLIGAAIAIATGAYASMGTLPPPPPLP